MSRSASRWVKSHSPCSGRMLCQMSSSANWLVKSHYPYSDWMLSQISSSASRFVNRTWARVWNQSMCHKSITTGSQSVARWWVAFWQFEYRTADRMASFMHRHHLLEVKTEKAETSKWQAVFNIPASPNPNALSDIFADIPRLLSMAFPAWQPTLEIITCFNFDLKFSLECLL